MSLPLPDYISQDFKNLALTGDSLQGKTFTSCTFIKCSFRETSFLHCTFQDCAFRKCDLSLATLKDCTFKNVRFEDSQLIGVNWMDTNLAQTRHILAKPVDFLKCVLNHSVFMGLSLKDASLIRCIAHEVSFEDADLTRTDCTFTDFSGSRFLHTNLTEADFTGAEGYAISPSLNTLKKTKFSLPEAMSLLHGLDIILTDPQS